MSEWHTRKWYKEKFGVDPSKLDIEFIEVRNPHFSSASPMKLWEEKNVLPFKNKDGIKVYKKRKKAGVKAYCTRKKHLKEWFKQVKSKNPRIQEIMKRLWKIGEDISWFHDLKEECRNTNIGFDKKDFFEYGVAHCKHCEKWTEEQDMLRDEREKLFEELKKICDKDLRTIQLARKYCREERAEN